MYTETLTQRLCFNADPTVPAAKTSSFNSDSIDLSKFKRAMFIIAVGAVSGTSPTLDAKWQESTDDSTFTDVSGTGVAITQVTAGTKFVTLEIRADQLTKRYARIAFTIGGTSPSFTMAVIGIGSDANFKPGNSANSSSVTEQKVAA